MRLLPVEALGRTLDEFRELLGVTEQARIQVEDHGTYAKFLQTGIAVLLKDHRIASIFLYAEGHDGYQAYRGNLGNLRLGASKQTVRFLFGQPSAARETADFEVLGTVPIYDRYDYDEFSYHFQYDEIETRLRMLTIMSSEG